MTSPLNPTNEYLAGMPIPQGQTFCGTSLSSLLLAGIHPLTNPSPCSNLTVRIEVVNPFILVASIICGYSKHMPRGASCYFT